MNIVENGPSLDRKALIYLQIDDNPPAKAIAQELWATASRLADKSYWIHLLTCDDFFDVFRPYAQESASIRRLLCTAQEVILFAATIGPDIENLSRRLMKKNEVFRGYVLDRIGSYLVEHEIRRLDKRLEVLYEERGWFCTRRFSPGYGDFPLEAQTVLVSLARDEFPVLEVTPAGFILPEKTVTAVKGVMTSPW